MELDMDDTGRLRQHPPSAQCGTHGEVEAIFEEKNQNEPGETKERPVVSGWMLND
jgi:hypothetical protein